MTGRGVRIFSGTSNPDLARGIADSLDIPLGAVTVFRFADGEIDREPVNADVQKAPHDAAESEERQRPEMKRDGRPTTANARVCEENAGTHWRLQIVLRLAAKKGGRARRRCAG